MKQNNSILYKNALKIADYVYSIMDNIPEEERFPVQFTIRNSAFELTSAVAESEATMDPRDEYWKLGHAKRFLAAIKNGLQQSHKRKFVQLDAEIMLLIDATIKDVDAALETSKSKFAAYFAFLDADTYKAVKESQR